MNVCIKMNAKWASLPHGICGFHNSDYEECRILRCGAVWILWEPMFQRNLINFCFVVVELNDTDRETHT
jgi:hypothetical protein